MSLKFIKHTEYLDTGSSEWYEVMNEGVKIMTVKRLPEWPHKWQAYSVERKEIFSPNKYRNDLFEELDCAAES